MNSEEWIKLCKKCQDIRVKAGYTQVQAAEELGISEKAISHFENGRSTNGKILMWYMRLGEKNGTLQSLEG